MAADEERRICHSTVRAKDEDDDDSSDNISSTGVPNKFVNDGSFLEMFKKMQNTSKGEEKAISPSAMSASSSQKTINQSQGSRPSVMVGKRRGNIILKTGAVKKVKKEEKESTEKKTGWSKYMEEVEKYKATSCKEDDFSVPLVK